MIAVGDQHDKAGHMWCPAHTRAFARGLCWGNAPAHVDGACVTRPATREDIAYGAVLARQQELPIVRLHRVRGISHMRCTLVVENSRQGFVHSTVHSYSTLE